METNQAKFSILGWLVDKTNSLQSPLDDNGLLISDSSWV